LTYRDSLGQQFPNVVATDVDSARPTAVRLSHFGARANLTNGAYLALGALGLLMCIIVVGMRCRVSSHRRTAPLWYNAP